jgi:hypothetical protein
MHLKRFVSIAWLRVGERRARRHARWGEDPMAGTFASGHYVPVVALKFSRAGNDVSEPDAGSRSIILKLIASL